MAFALTPIAVAVNRDNNTDTWLMFFLLLAAWAITLAAEKGRLALLVLSMALVGVAFNVKMLEAWIVLPAFYLLYLIAAPIRWPKRLAHLAVGTVVVLVVSLSWAVAVDLTPADGRPWIGGSQTNSVLNLALGYNGLGRVTGQENGPGSTGTGRPSPQGMTPPTGTAPDGTQQFNGQPPTGDGPGFQNGPNGGPNSGSGMFGAGVAGPTRLFGSELADQWSWLLPLAGFGVLATALGLRRRLPLEPRGQAMLLWGGWLGTYGVVFSLAQGIFHTYYLVMLAPATAALVGIGLYGLWQAYRRGGWPAWLLPLALLGTAIWQIKILADYPQWSGWLVPITLGGAVLAAVPLIVTRLFTRRAWRRLAPALVTLALMAAFVAPALWSVSPVLAAGNGTMPEATAPSIAGIVSTTSDQAMNRDGGQPGQMGGPHGDTANSSLITYLQANQDGTFYLVAVSSANQASSIALSTGQPVLAMGGFTGSDPAMTVEKMQALVATHQVRNIMLGGQGGGTNAITSWVQANGTLVDATTYGGQSGTTGNFGGGPGGTNGQLYDLAAK
jgi:4-amino-4-deoxy-L-arabinose transferase-like glycosyltransferase